MDTVLTVENLTVSRGGEPVVEEVSFTLERGEMVALIGPNGSGKTTLFRALLGLVAHRGSVRWRPGIRIGYVPQRFSVAPATPITVEEFFLLKSGRFWSQRRLASARFRRQLFTMGLQAEILRRPLDALSSGQLQRLLVAWATLDEPDVLLFDEPSAAVDVGFSETIYAIMERMRGERGTTVLFISHDLHIVSRYVSRVLCLNRLLLCQGPPTETLVPGRLRELFGDVSVYRHGPAPERGHAA